MSICKSVNTLIVNSKKSLSFISTQVSSSLTTIQNSPSFITNAVREVRRAPIAGAVVGGDGADARGEVLVVADVPDAGVAGLRGAAKPTTGASAGRVRGDDGAMSVVLMR